MRDRCRAITYGQGRDSCGLGGRDRETQENEAGGRQEGCAVSPGDSVVPFCHWSVSWSAHISKELPEPSRIQGLQLCAMLPTENI